MQYVYGLRALGEPRRSCSLASGLAERDISAYSQTAERRVQNEADSCFVRRGAHRRLRVGAPNDGTKGRKQPGVRLRAHGSDPTHLAADPDRSVLGELPAGPAQHQQDVLIAAPRSAAPRRGSR